MVSRLLDRRVLDGRVMPKVGCGSLSAVRLPRGLPPPSDPFEKCIPRARRPDSSSPSDSACKMTPAPPDEALENGA
eukprot:6926834-Alexandrium_andersonii.AAC.1